MAGGRGMLCFSSERDTSQVHPGVKLKSVKFSAVSACFFKHVECGALSDQTECGIK